MAKLYDKMLNFTYQKMQVNHNEIYGLLELPKLETDNT